MASKLGRLLSVAAVICGSARAHPDSPHASSISSTTTPTKLPTRKDPKPDLPTLAVTTPLQVVPTPLIGFRGYSHQGCFAQARADRPGLTLGENYIMPGNASMADKMTLPFCIEACAATRTEDGEGYELVGVGDGR
jgi:hypothetical protein